MKPPFALILGAAVFAAAAAGCGQPGPLYMPKPPAKPVAPTAATPPSPADPAAPATSLPPPASSSPVPTQQ